MAEEKSKKEKALNVYFPNPEECNQVEREMAVKVINQYLNEPAS